VKELLVRLALALVVIGSLTAGAWWLVERGAGPAPDANRDGGVGSQVPADASPAAMTEGQARSELQRIGEVSQRLMPEGYEQVFLGMSLQDLRAERRRIQRENEARPDGQQLWAEDDPSGARVVYLVSTRGLLTQVQFMSRIDGTDGLAPHFAALNQRYGRPTGIWDCPESADSSPVRRFTWRREGASVMEAVLIHGQSVSLTLIVSPTEDVGAALQRARCEPVRTPEQLQRFPVAGELRGARTNFVREVLRDAG
jgi:hypothetical protein